MLTALLCLVAVMSLRVVHAGSGYQYLLRSVATNDADPQGRRLHDYYAAKGTPQGRWIGSGLAGLASEKVVAGNFVTEDQMSALYGEGLHPDTDEMVAAGRGLKDCQLGRAYPIYTNGNEVLKAIATAEKEFRRIMDRRPTEQERSDIVLSVASPQFAKFHDGAQPENGKQVIAWVTELQKDARQAVAGYDLTFSPVKSVSVLWGLADKDTSKMIAKLHHEAVAETLAWAEQTCLFSRRGSQGIAQLPALGMVASEFTHFETRGGDPDLHSHVLVANRVQTKDGSWVTIDGRPLFEYKQTLSGRYNAILQHKLQHEMGVMFTPRMRAADKPAVWEVEGVSDEVIEMFSSRRQMAKPVHDRMVAEWVQKHGTQPTRQQLYEIWQAAILETRDAKKPAESLDSLRAQWAEVVGQRSSEEDQAALEKLCENTARTAAKTEQEDDATAGAEGEKVAEDKAILFDFEQHHEAVAAQAMEMVQSRRATFKRSHVDTAIAQELRGFVFADDQARDTAHEQMVEHVMESIALCLTPDELLDLPKALQRWDGKGVDRLFNCEVYTTAEQLRRERKVIEATKDPLALFVSEREIAAELKRFERKNGFSLNPGQASMVQHFLTSGTVVSAAVGPAGTGKTTSMAVVARLWQRQGRNVWGLAPSSAAATVLEADIETTCKTVDWLTFQWAQLKEQGLSDQEIVSGEHWPIKAGDMLLVDEAGMVSTSRMAMLTDIAYASGAKICMVGDPYQLDAVETGGLFRTIVNQARTPELQEVMRMKVRDHDGTVRLDDEQAQASMDLRVGKNIDEAIRVYESRNWITGGAHQDMLIAVTEAYLNDVDAGKTTLAMASTNTDVTAMNEIIQQAMVERGKVDLSTTIMLADGLSAGVGDKVCARQNMFIEQDSGRAVRVYNGQQFVISEIHGSGIVGVDVRSGKKVWLDQDYISQHAQLAYAATLHRAQGATVDTGHALITPMADRNAAYVAITRGKWANKMYVVRDQVLDQCAEDSHMHHSGDDEARELHDIVRRVFVRDESQKSALDTMDEETRRYENRDRVKNLYVAAVDEMTHEWAEKTVDELMETLPLGVINQIDDDGRDALINATTWAMRRDINVRSLWPAVSDDLGGSYSPGRLIGSRIRSYVEEQFGTKVPQGRMVTMPPPYPGVDVELYQWLQQAREVLTTTSPEDTSEEELVQKLSAKALAGRALIDLVATPEVTPRRRDVETDDAAAHTQGPGVRSTRAAHGMSLVDLVATPSDGLNSVSKTGKNAVQQQQEEDQHPAEQFDHDHTHDHEL